MAVNPQDLLNLLPGIITQTREALSQLGWVEKSLITVEAREADKELDRKAAIFDQNFCRLLWLTNNLNQLLSLTREAPPILRDLNLADAVGEFCEQAAGLGELMGLRFRYICARKSILCAVDWDGLETILLHLLANAFRHTPSGGLITVELSQSGQRVHLSVQDSGPGISRDRLDSIFLTDNVPDALTSSSLTISDFQGASLGLPLCRHLAQRQGAALLVESPPEGVGTRFTLSLPLRTCGTMDAPLWDFSGGVNHVLLGLSGVLPVEAFLIRYQ